MVIPSWKGMQESSQQMKTVLEPTIKDKKDELAAVQRKVMWDLSGKQWYRLFIAALFSYSRGLRGELHVHCNNNCDGFSLSIWRRYSYWSHADNFKGVVVRLKPLKKGDYWLSREFSFQESVFSLSCSLIFFFSLWLETNVLDVILTTVEVILKTLHCRDYASTCSYLIFLTVDPTFFLELLKSTMEKFLTDMEDTMKEIVELLKPKVKWPSFFFQLQLKCKGTTGIPSLLPFLFSIFSQSFFGLKMM